MSEKVPEFVQDNVRFHLAAWSGQVDEIYANSHKERAFAQWFRENAIDEEANDRIGRCIDELGRRVRNEQWTKGADIKLGHLKDLYKRFSLLDHEAVTGSVNPSLDLLSKCPICIGKGLVEVCFYWNIEHCKYRAVHRSWVCDGVRQYAQPWPCDRMFTSIQPCNCMAGVGPNKNAHCGYSQAQLNYIVENLAFRVTSYKCEYTASDFVMFCMRAFRQKYGTWSEPDKTQRTKMKQLTKKAQRDPRSIQSWALMEK